jgi:hypothetical protein
MKKYFYLFAAVLLSACAAKISAPTDVQLTEASKYYPGITISDLNDSKALYENSCGSCHPLKKPSSRTEEQWRTIMPKMVVKANKKGYGIDKMKEDKLLAYVLSARNTATPQ